MKVQSVKSVAWVAAVIALAGLLCLGEARPMDLYDDVSEFFDAISLDAIPTSGRTAPEAFCRMPVRKGVCRALIPRWSYDPQRKDCVEFKFGGCDGNENNFATYNQCMATCKGM